MLEAAEQKRLLVELEELNGVVFVRVDSVEQRAELLDLLRSHWAGEDTVPVLEAEARDPIEAMLAAADDEAKVVVLTDEGLQDADCRRRWLQSLNTGRDRLRELRAPVAFVVSRDILDTIAQEAPDFWSWRGGVYEMKDDVPPPLVQHFSGRRGIGVDRPSIAGLRIPYRNLSAQEGDGSAAFFIDPGLEGWGRQIAELVAKIELEDPRLFVVQGNPGIGMTTALWLLTRKLEGRQMQAVVADLNSDVMLNGDDAAAVIGSSIANAGLGPPAVTPTAIARYLQRLANLQTSDGQSRPILIVAGLEGVEFDLRGWLGELCDGLLESQIAVVFATNGGVEDASPVTELRPIANLLPGESEHSSNMELGRQILEARVGSALAQDGIEPLVRFAGGLPKNLIQLTRGAVLNALVHESASIELEHVMESVDESVRELRRFLTTATVEQLCVIARKGPVSYRPRLRSDRGFFQQTDDGSYIVHPLALRALELS